jgi:hypothetical protein
MRPPLLPPPMHHHPAGSCARVILSGLVCLTIMMPAPRAAQAQDLPADTAPFHLGPVGLSPRVALTNVGVDTNVYNAERNPTSDFTATLVPGLKATLPIRRALVTGNASAELLYFQETASQRSATFSADGRFDLPLGVIAPFVTGGQATTHQRPNSEIDVRVGQTVQTLSAGAVVRLGSRTSLTVDGERRDTAYDEVTFAGANLAASLNRQTDTARAAFRVTLTPLTTLLVRSEYSDERFAEEPFRDTDSVAALAGFELRPFALIGGKALVGYRSMTSVTGELPDFSGVIADVDVFYAWREMTRVAVQFERGVEPSFEDLRPYYVLTGGLVTISQAVALRWDLVGRLGRDAFDYRDRVGAADPILARGDQDRVDTIGGGLGFRAAPELRVGFDVNYHRRRTTTATRSYEGFRIGGSVTYGQ